MYRGYDMDNGLPPRIYRTPREIRRDICAISERVRETSEMLNIRSLLTEIIMNERLDTPEKLLPELEATIEEAKSALREMTLLSEELSMLEEELRETRWHMEG
jgi:hypothetical protein